MVTCIDTRHFLSTGTVMHYLYHIRSHRSVNDHKVRTILILHLVHCQRVGGGREGRRGVCAGVCVTLYMCLYSVCVCVCVCV